MTNPSTHLFWITSRAAGTTAMVLSSAAVGYGLMMSTKLIKGNQGDRRQIHEILSLSVMVAIAVHAVTLIFDKYLHPSLVDVTLPFAMSYKTLPSAIGIVSGWALIALGLSFYARKRIGIQRWKLIHRFTALAWIGALVHTFSEGTDAGSLWFIALIGVTAAPAAALLAAKLAGASGRRTANAERAATVPVG